MSSKQREREKEMSMGSSKPKRKWKYRAPSDHRARWRWVAVSTGESGGRGGHQTSCLNQIYVERGENNQAVRLDIGSKRTRGGRSGARARELRRRVRGIRRKKIAIPKVWTI